MKKEAAPITKEQFKSLRKELNISVSSFAYEIGVHFTTVHKWENGEVPLPKYAMVVLESLSTNLWKSSIESRFERIGSELEGLKEVISKF